MVEKKVNLIEKIFETILWKSRLMVIFAVVFGVFAALGLFLLGSYEIWTTLANLFSGGEHVGSYEFVIIGIVGAVDLYLIGIVLLLFSFGVYELFVSRIDIARFDTDINILEIKSLDELKNKVLKVVVVVLVVNLFKTILTTKFTTPVDILFFAIAIVAVSFGVHLLRKKEED